MNTALVTGAAGLLGTATVNRLADAGVEVHALVRSEGQRFRDDVQFHVADLTRPLDVHALPNRVDAIFHLAQAREFRDFPQSALSVFAINVATTAVLLDYARSASAQSFVYASSGGVYLGLQSAPLTEDSPLHAPGDLGYYLSTKLSSEALVGSYAAEFSTAALRYFFIYGQGQARSMLIPRLYDRVRNGEPISLQGRDGMRINPVHVNDAAAATIAAADLAGQTTANVAGPEAMSLREIGELFGTHCGREPLFEQVAGPPADLIGSTERMDGILLSPTITLRQALSDISV